MYYWLSSASSGMPSPSASGNSGRPARLVARLARAASAAVPSTSAQSTSRMTALLTSFD